MGVDHGHVVDAQPGLLQGAANGPHGARPTGRGQGDVRGVGRGAIAHQLGERLDAAGPGMGQRFQHDHAGPLADDKAVAVGVERPGRPLGLIVSSGKGAHGGEAGHERFVARGLRTAGEHHVGVAAPDRLPGLADGVAAGGAGGDDAEVRALRTEEDGDHTRGQVADRHRDQERRHAVRALLAHQQNLIGEGPDAADAGADDDAGPFGQLPFEAGRQPGLIHGLAGGDERELDVAVVAALLLAVEDRGWVEVLDLGGDPGRKARRIELRDGADARAAGDHRLPRRRHVESERCDGAHAGDDDARLAVGRTHRTSFPVRIVAARYTSPGRPRAETASETAMKS